MRPEPHFFKYDKMNTSTAKVDPDEIKRLNSAKFCVTEKVHGANFSLHVKKNGAHMYAKRTGYLKPDEDFFRYQEMAARDFKGLHNLAMAVHELKGTNKVILYGELFGGIYPGEDSHTKFPIQSTIYYSPRVEFMIFDIAYVTGPG